MRCFNLPHLLIAGIATLSIHADTYRVASSSDGYNPISAVINNSGVVLFYGNRQSSSGEQFRGIYKARTTVATVMEDSLDHPPAAGEFQLISQAQQGDYISMNNGGRVAFYGWKGAGSKPLVYVTSGAIARGNFAYSSDNISPTPLTITDDSFVAYDRIVRSPEPRVGAYTGSQVIGPLNNVHEFLRQDGASYARIQLGVINQDLPFSDLAPIHTNSITGIPIGAPFVMNDHGVIAFFKSQISGSSSVFGIYTYSGGGISTVVEMTTVNGVTTSEFEFAKPVFAINNNNVVAFYAKSKTLKREGFFRGASPLTDKIVAVGDFIDTFRITSLRVPNGALGQTRKMVQRPRSNGRLRLRRNQPGPPRRRPLRHDGRR